MTDSQTPLPRARRSLDTLADLQEQLASDARLDATQRRTYEGALRTVCKVLARPAHAIPADPRRLEPMLKDLPPSGCGVSRKTLANVRSQLKAALRHCLEAPKFPPRGTPLKPDWQALYDRLSELRLRNGLSRLIRVASYRGVAPDQVDDAFLQQLLDEVSRQNWGRDTLPFWRTAVALWDEAAATIPGWPQRRLTPPPASLGRQHLALEHFPQSFRDDLDAHLRWASGADLLAEEAPPGPLKPSSLRLRREHLRVAASTLAGRIGDTASITSLAALVVPAHTKLILSTYLEASKDRQPTAYLRGLALTLVAVARHWVKVSDEDLQELLRLKRKLGTTPSGLTEKNRRIVGHCTDPTMLRTLLKLPDALREQVRTRRLSPARRLQKMQIALAIELLLAAPMRLQNLATLRLDHQLQWPAGRGGPVFITLRPDETKNDQPLEYPIEGHTRDLLHEYLDRYRAYAKVADTDWLFVHLDGTPMPAAALRDGITKATKRELGVAITPHQFRHLAAAITLDSVPGAIGMVRDLLGHRSIKTTINAYAGMRTKQAAREWSKILDGARSTDGHSGGHHG